jgi:hypothetical protein
MPRISTYIWFWSSGKIRSEIYNWSVSVFVRLTISQILCWSPLAGMWRSRPPSVAVTCYNCCPSIYFFAKIEGFKWPADVKYCLACVVFTILGRTFTHDCCSLARAVRQAQDFDQAEVNAVCYITLSFFRMWQELTLPYAPSCAGALANQWLRWNITSALRLNL